MYAHAMTLEPAGRRPRALPQPCAVHPSDCPLAHACIILLRRRGLRRPQDLPPKGAAGSPMAYGLHRPDGRRHRIRPHPRVEHLRPAADVDEAGAWGCAVRPAGGPGHALLGRRPVHAGQLRCLLGADERSMLDRPSPSLSRRATRAAYVHGLRVPRRRLCSTA